jgi:preprotein translocase subunit YajC
MSMSSKKNTQASLKIGSRVRCTDDGVTGRIAWANAVSVKIKWDDGEEVTWKRDSLVGRPIEILDSDDDTEQVTPDAVAPTDQPATEGEPQSQAETLEPAVEMPPVEPTAAPDEPGLAFHIHVAEATNPTAEPATTEASANPDAPEPSTVTAPAKPKRQRKAVAPTEPTEKKLSAIDAAVKVLGEAGQAMTTQEMIEAMASKGYWSSPGGRTPSATLYSSILRELDVKGEQARFVKAAPGRFSLRAAPNASAS